MWLFCWKRGIYPLAIGLSNQRNRYVPSMDDSRFSPYPESRKEVHSGEPCTRRPTLICESSQMNNFKRLLIGAALFVSGSATAASIINGSFEDNVLANGTWSTFYNGSVNGWSSGPTPDYGIEIRNNVAGQAYQGKNFVELDTFRNSVAYQGISTTAGEVYDLSFAYSTRPGVTGPANTNNISVFWNGSSLGTFGGINASSTTNNWILYTVQVVGTGGSDELRFAATGTSDSYGGSLDAVAITTAVPEPEVYAMMGLGLGLLGWVGRRRKLAA
jgi:hypothetical protein